MARAKRGQGQGSYYQRADGLFCYSIRQDGRRRTVSARTKTDLQAKVRALTAELARSPAGHATQAPAAQAVEGLCREWLESVIRPGRAAKTYQLYEGIVRLRIVPHIGRIKLASLTPAHVAAMLAALKREGVTPDGLDKTRRYLRAAVNVAVRWGWVERNVVTLTEPPRKSEPEPRQFTDDDAHRILAAIRGHEFEGVFTVQLCLGLRLGEVLGLRERDLIRHPGTGQITALRVSLQLAERGKDGDIDASPYVLAPLKTAGSRRTLLLPRRAVEAIETAIWVNRLAEESGAWPDTERARQAKAWGLLFRAPDSREGRLAVAGGPIRQDRARQALYRAIEKAGVEKVRTHDLRHLCATLLLADGIPLKVVQEILGHSNAMTTLKRYAHALPATHAAAAASMDAAIGEERDGGG